MVVIRDERKVRGMFWKVFLTLIMVMYFMSCSLCKFFFRVRMMYFGCRIVLLRVGKGLNICIFFLV